MLDRTTLILLDSKAHRHSLNALVGALETAQDLDELELCLPANEVQLGLVLARTLALGRRAVVGLSFSTPQLWHIRDLHRRLNAQFPEPRQVLWVAGGPHPTADPEGTLRLGFDLVVRGEGEATFIQLLRAFASGDSCGGVPWSAVPGLTWRTSSGQVDATGRSPSVDLEAFPPFPLRRRRVVGPIEITRGCPFACAYCQTSHLLGAGPRHRSPETIARYAAVIRQRNLRDVRIVTPNAFSYGSPDGKTLNLAAREALLAALRRTLGAEGRLFFGTFPSEVRPEHVHAGTLELVQRYANNRRLVIGAQSGSERMLERCGRGHRVGDVLAAVTHTLAAGLQPLVDFIFGLPGETPADLDDTIAVIRELARMGALIHAHTFVPLPQTRFAGEPPGEITGRLRPVLKELIRQGSLFGVWHTQAAEAPHIARYLRQGQL